MNVLNIPLTFSETVLLLRLLEGLAETNTLTELQEAGIPLSDFASLLEKVRQLDDCFIGKEVPF